MTAPDLTPLPEDRWTQPSGWCPRPGLWHSTDDDSTEIEVSEMLAGLVRALQPELCVETGSAWGQTSELIGRVLQANGHGRLVSLEVDEERVAYTKSRCAGLPVDVLAMPSLDWEPDGPVGFAFFDSLIPLRVPEFLRYQPWMEPGTVVAFHDTAPGHGFVDGHDLVTDVTSKLADHLTMINLRTPRGVTIGACT